MQIDEARSRELFELLPEDRAARDELIRMYRPLAEYLARRYEGRYEELDDLVQVASIGLIKALDRFDPERGVKFTTYATATIVGELKRHFRDKGWTVRVPRRLQEVSLETRRVVSELRQQLGRSPTVKEIAERSSYTEEEVLEGMQLGQAYNPQSLHAYWDDEDGMSPLKHLGSPDERMELVDGLSTVEPIINSLPERERRILVLRFFKDMTQREIAEEVGISQMHVSRLLSRTLEQIRQQLGDPVG